MLKIEDTLCLGFKHMWYPITTALRILAFLSGLLCIYAALFIYENEQGKIQSVLEELWLRIDDRRQTFLSRHTLFMREVARFTESRFDRLFGKKLFSLQSVAVSSCYSIASICMMLSYHIYPGNLYSEEYGNSFLPSLMLLTIGFILLGTLPFFIRRSRPLKLWFTSVVISVLSAASVLYILEHRGWTQFFYGVKHLNSAGHRSILWENAILDITGQLINRWDFIGIMLAGYWIGICLGIASDIAFIAITRRTLRWGSQLESFFRIFTLILLNCFLALVLSLGPALIGFGTAFVITGHSSTIPGQEPYPDNYTIAPFSLPIFAQAIQQIGFIASLSNVITALSATIFILLAFILLAHRLFWPLIERPVYALQRLGIARRSKFLGSLGIILIGIGLGFVPGWLKDIVDKLNS